MPPAVLLMPGSLNGEPGEELELPGTVPPAASMSWQDWLGSPVPLGLPAASAGAAPATTKNPVRSPAVTAARMINLPGYRLADGPPTGYHERLPTTVHDHPGSEPVRRRLCKGIPPALPSHGRTTAAFAPPCEFPYWRQAGGAKMLNTRVAKRAGRRAKDHRNPQRWNGAAAAHDPPVGVPKTLRGCIFMHPTDRDTMQSSAADRSFEARVGAWVLDTVCAHDFAGCFQAVVSGHLPLRPVSSHGRFGRWNASRQRPLGSAAAGVATGGATV